MNSKNIVYETVVT